MITTNFCGNMHKFREMRGVSFADLSQMLRSNFNIDVSPSTLQRYEVGKIRTVPYDSITALANCFMVTPPMLMGWEQARALNEGENDLLDLWQRLSTTNKNIVINLINSLLDAQTKQKGTP